MNRIKQDFQQILLALQQGELDPSCLKQLAEEMELELARNRRRGVLLALLFLLLGMVLAGMLCRPKQVVAEPVTVTPIEETIWIPQYTLSAESLWVMSYKQVALDPELMSTTNQPFTTQWVKNVAYHLIMGQQALAMVTLEEPQ